jgi:murein DD-endopeptidase MepM/ murein hydrolase activator NlpD
VFRVQYDDILFLETPSFSLLHIGREVIVLRQRTKLDRLKRFFAWRHWDRRQLAVVGKKVTPYLKGKYWLIYLAAFILGFYLFGPTHGWQKLRRTVFSPGSVKKAEPVTIAALQRELRLLKQDLQKLTGPSPDGASFTPEDFIRPAAGEIIQGYQWTLTNHIWRLHPGVDFRTPLGGAVVAAAAGRVVGLERTGAGVTIRLSHGNAWESSYADLAGARVRMGQAVTRGQIVGVSGMVHCCDPARPGFHFGLYHKQEAVDPHKYISALR